MKRIMFAVTVICAAVLFTSCYSIFSGATGGRVVDGESNLSPKAGIPDVEVYAYTDAGMRDRDFSSWDGISHFSPRSDYYARTTTASDGSFVLSKIIWKENKPDFGKDGDYTNVYLLFYHENYGLEKGGTLIVSDSSSDTVYKEMTRIRKTTELQINLVDVVDYANATEPVLVTISVPQTTETLTDVPDRKTTAVISGMGKISVSYPRWKSNDDKVNGIENTPEITFQYEVAGDEKSWKACYNGDSATGNYEFLSGSDLNVSRTISGDSYKIRLYGKKAKLKVPYIDGTYGNTTSETNDGVVIHMEAQINGTSIDCGHVTTVAQTIGTSGVQKHGVFSHLGDNVYWWDNTYEGKYVNLDVIITAPDVSSTLHLRSNQEKDDIKL